MKHKNLLLLSSILSITFTISCNDNKQNISNENKSNETISVQDEKSSISSVEESSLPLIESSSEDDANLLDKWEEHDCYSFSYKKLGKDVMPIGGWCSPVDPYITNEQYAMIKECGLNSIYGLYENVEISYPNVIKALECAQNNDLIYLVRDSSLYLHSEDIDDFKAHMEKFTKYDSYGGTLVMDEPGMDSFDSLAYTAKLFRQYYSQYAHYVNLFPMYASASQFETRGKEPAKNDTTFDIYAREYITKVRPQFFSFDYYPVSGDYPNLSQEFLHQLYVVSKLCDEYKIPFWTFIQTCNFGGRSRIPTKEELYYQINASLAYGAKGIQYFCYFMPTEFIADGYGGNLVDANGNKTVLYDYAKKINNQIANMDNVLMRSTLIGQMAYGDNPACVVTQDNLIDSIREIKSVETNDNAIVSCFDYDGKSVFYIMNNSTQDDASIKINFTSNVIANVVDIDGKTNFEGDVANIELAPGEGVMYEITNYK